MATHQGGHSDPEGSGPWWCRWVVQAGLCMSQAAQRMHAFTGSIMNIASLEVSAHLSLTPLLPPPPRPPPGLPYLNALTCTLPPHTLTPSCALYPPHTLTPSGALYPPTP